MRNPEDTKYVWDKRNFNIIQNSMSKEKSYLTLKMKIKQILVKPILFILDTLGQFIWDKLLVIAELEGDLREWSKK